MNLTVNFLIISLLSSFAVTTAFGDLLGTGIGGNSSGEVLTQDIRHFADEFAELFLRKRLTLQSAGSLINETVSAQLEFYRTEIAQKNPDFSALRSQVYDKLLNQDSSYREKSLAVRMGFVYTLLIGSGAIFAIPGESEALSWMKMLAFAHLILAFKSADSSPYMRLCFALYRKFTNGNVNRAFHKIFFGRLSEIGIHIPNSQRESWLMSQLDGNPISDWGTLSNSEKLRWAKDYAEYLRNMANAYATEPEVSSQLHEMSRQVTEKLPSGISRWRSKPFRVLSQAMGNAFFQMMTLQKTHPFMRDPARLSTLFANQREIFDHREILSDRAREFFLDLKMGMPSDLEASLPRIKELGGSIDVAWELSHSAPKEAAYRFEIRVTFPDAEPLTFQNEVSFDPRATDLNFAHLSAFPDQRLKIQAALQHSAVVDGFALALKHRWEVKNPSEACAQALSVAENAMEAAL